MCVFVKLFISINEYSHKYISILFSYMLNYFFFIILILFSFILYENNMHTYKYIGTSTRKPRLNSALVAQQAATLPGASGVPNGNSNSKSSSKSSRNKHKHKKYPARLTNVDRSTAQTREVTVNSVTVVITEYKPKQVTSTARRESSEQSYSESNDSRC